MDEPKWKVDEWTGCYPSNWKGLIVPAAMSHPAKFSNRLIRKIYEHMKEEEWLKAGDTVIDPFGGVALGGLDAMRMGLRWVGCELEPKFVELGNWNISHWNAKFHRMPNWSGEAVLLQGDSRKLLEVISGQRSAVSGTVSSPPFEQRSADGGWQMFGKYAQEGKLTVKQVKGDANKSYPSWDAERDTSYGDSDGQMANMKSTEEGFNAAVGSPPYADSDLNYKKNGLIHDGEHYERPYMDGQGDEMYGATPGQLAGMKNEGFDASISSPPFLQSEGGTPEPKPGGVIDERLYARHAAGNSAAEGYGGMEGQLGNMREVSSFEFQVSGSVSSPPFEDSLDRGYVDAEGRRQLARENGISNAEFISPIDMEKIGKRNQEYGTTDGQLGADSGDDFWMAARAIVEQVYLALEPGGHAAWVCKDFVKNKARVPFSDQWRQLCEAVGFVTLHEHRAMLVKSLGSQHTTDGDIIHQEKKYASFFRRLAEKKGSPKIEWETIWCMEKRKDV